MAKNNDISTIIKVSCSISGPASGCALLLASTLRETGVWDEKQGFLNDFIVWFLIIDRSISGRVQRERVWFCLPSR